MRKRSTFLRCVATFISTLSASIAFGVSHCACLSIAIPPAGSDDFTVGGSISVNCHGWQPESPPIADTVQAFVLLRADGSIVECRRDRESDHELFSAVCGGYGLFGIILQVELRVVSNQLYKAQEFAATARNYAERYDSLIVHDDQP